MFITKTRFLNLFDNNSNFSYDDFLNNAIVKLPRSTIPIKEYMKTKKIKKDTYKRLYHQFINKDLYLSNFFDKSLKYPYDISITDEPMSRNALNNNSKSNYKNFIRNLHYREILKNTTSGLGRPSFLNVILDFYNKLIIDYNLIIPSSLFYIEQNKISGVFSSLFFRASILNPYLIYSLNMNVLKGTKIFTPTLGWSSYCYGFLECPIVKEYVGTDIITSVCYKTASIADKYYPKKKVNILCKQSELLLNDNRFLNKYSEYFDTVFFSPPYYKLEIYSGKNQSTNLYKSYEEWLDKYWKNTILLCYFLLKKGSKLCYILSGYGKDLEYNLEKDMNDITAEYFHFKEKIRMYNKNVFVTKDKHRETSEFIYIFQK